MNTEYGVLAVMHLPVFVHDGAISYHCANSCLFLSSRAVPVQVPGHL